MNIRIREVNNITIIDIEGQIDINSSEIIETVGWLIKDGKRDILLNFDKVEMVDYSGISIMAITYKNVTNHDGRIKFCTVALHIEKLFKLAQLDSIFEIYKDEETALKTFCFDSDIDKKLLRRRFERLDMHIEVEFCVKKELKNNKIWNVGKLLNLSGDGVFLYTKKLLPLGEEIRVKINLYGEKPFEIDGIVIWIADKSLQPQLHPGMGIHFKSIGKKNQERVLEFINKHITHRSIT